LVTDTKYNHKASIPIDSIPKEEIGTAIEEWSEGNEHLKQLLWNCYNNGIKTNGCCGDCAFYIDFSFPNSEKLGTLFETMYSIPNTQISIHVDGAPNIFGDTEWYKTVINFGVPQVKKEERLNAGNKMFDTLNNAFINNLNEEKSIDNSILNLISFLKDKESGIVFRIYNNDNSFSFEVQLDKENDRFYEQLNNLFIRIGLSKEKNDAPFHYWIFESTNLNVFKDKISQISKAIIEELKIDPLTEEQANIRHNKDKLCTHTYYVSNLYAHYMKRTLSEEEYNKWYNRQVEIYNLYREKKRVEEEKQLASPNQSSEKTSKAKQ
jgi:hypothetical protein